MFIFARSTILNRRRMYCHVDVEERRKHQNRMIPVHAVAGKNTKIAVGNNHEEPHIVLPHFFDNELYIVGGL